MKQPKILILHASQSHEIEELNHAFVESLNIYADGAYKCTFMHYKDVAIVLDGSLHAYSLIDDTSLSNYDLVYFKKVIGCEEMAFAIAKYFEAKKIPFICSEVKEGFSNTKLSQYVRLTMAGIRLPKSKFVPNKNLGTAYKGFVESLGLPFVLKATNARGGEENFLISSASDYEAVMSLHVTSEFIAQEFIPNDGDLRVLVFGQEIALVIERKRLDDSTHLNNTSQGAYAEIIPIEELSKESIELCISAARATGREVAGVDLMFSKVTNEAYILEVNASPQLGSGAFVQEKLRAFHTYMLKLLNN